MDEQQKQRLLVAALAFNIVIIIYQISFNSGLFQGQVFSWGKLMLGILIAAVAGGAGYFGAKLME